jgi:Ca2+/H+ antiporter, TMEM165/GDT1 family
MLAAVGFSGGGLGLVILVPIIITLYFFFVWIFQLLWNWTMPQVFRLRPITYWQAFRILLIAEFAFGPGSWIRFGS